jgi:citrate synthase
MPERPEWLDLAIGAEEAILRVFEEMKPGRAMKTNVEFYAAAVLQGVGLAPDLFHATFGLARIAGWSAHAIEQAGVDKIIRPDAKYVGSAERHLPS